MAYMHSTHTAGHDNGLFVRISAFFAALVERRAQHRLFRETVDQLSALDARELADLGLSRAEISTVARGAVYGR